MPTIKEQSVNCAIRQSGLTLSLRHGTREAERVGDWLRTLDVCNDPDIRKLEDDRMKIRFKFAQSGDQRIELFRTH
jgi:hypothetical protein